MTVLVTGAAGGIGRAACLALDAARVAGPAASILGHDLPPVEQTGLDLGGDLADPAVLDTVEKALTGAGPLDAVVAAHGIAGAGALHELTAEAAGRIMQVNFETVVNLWERVRPLLEASTGTFVVVASQAGLVSEAANGVYSASKSALAGWLRGLDGHTTVRLRLVHPGATRTPLLESALRGMAATRGVSYEEVIAERNAATPAGRLGDPADIGAAIAWATRLEAAGLVEIAVTGGEVLH
jgi:NAD(P)-dependent dehydrogenase (short-subunit alcohol dehydrogenase family)